MEMEMKNWAMLMMMVGWCSYDGNVEYVSGIVEIVTYRCTCQYLHTLQ